MLNSNNVRVFIRTKILAIFEPTGNCRNDGKRPGGMTVGSRKLERQLVRDAACLDTVAPSHVSVSVGDEQSSREPQKAKISQACSLLKLSAFCG